MNSCCILLCLSLRFRLFQVIKSWEFIFSISLAAFHVYIVNFSLLSMGWSLNSLLDPVYFLWVLNVNATQIWYRKNYIVQTCKYDTIWSQTIKKTKQNKEQKMLWNSNYCDKIKKEGLKKLKEANTLGAQTINSLPDIGYQQLSLSSCSVAFLFLHDVICLHVNLCNVLM